MMKMNRYFITLLAAISLFFFSCNNIVQDVTTQKNAARFRVSIAEASSETSVRTVAPSFGSDYSGFQKFELKGDKGSSISENPAINETFETDESGSAYSKLNAAVMPLPLMTDSEQWTFKLTGYFSGKSADSATVYEQTKTFTLGADDNHISFDNLKRISAFKTSASDKNGNISFTLTFVNADEASAIAKVSAALYKDGESTSFTNDFAVSGTSAAISFTDVPVGKYDLNLTFLTANDIVIGYLKTEVTYVLEGLTSSLVDSSTTINLNTVYSITYKESNGTAFAGFDSGYSVPSEYSRFTPVSLPVKDNLSSSVNSSRIFLGWYETYEDGEFSNPVTQIAKNSRVENLTVYGKFVDIREQPTVTGVTFKYDDGDEASNLKVGHKLTAIPCYDNGGTSADFLGSITSWDWYYEDSDGSWKKISDTDVIKEDTAPGSDNNPAKSSINIKPDYAGKKIKVDVKQKYTITGPVNGVYSIAENTTTKSTESSAAVANGNLSKGTIVLQYDTVSVRGNSLSNSFSVKEGSLTDSKSTGWTYDKDKITAVVYNTESGGKFAPSVSGTVTGIPVKFSVLGYNDFETTLDVFVNVKYPTPTGSEALPHVEDTAAGRALITYGKMKFTDTSVDAMTIPMQYRFDEGSWSSVGKDEFSPSNTNGFTLKVRYAATTDKSLNQEGYIGESGEYYRLMVDEADAVESYLGTKVLLKSVELSGTAKVGTTLTATAIPDFTNTPEINFVADGYGTITWKWYAGDTLVKTTTGSHSTKDTLNIGEGAASGGGSLRQACYNKTIKVEAIYSYSNQGVSSIAAITKDKTSNTVAAGSIDVSNASLTYSKTEAVGATLSTSNLTVTGLKNDLGEDVLQSYASSITFDGKAPESSSDVGVTINVNGYNSVKLNVHVNVKAVAPVLGGGSGGGSTGGIQLLSEDNNRIPYGAIMFGDDPNNIYNLLEFCYRDDHSNALANWTDSQYWHNIEANRIVYENDFDATWNNLGDGTYFTATDDNWDIVWVRYKAKEGVSASDAVQLDIKLTNIGIRQIQIEDTFTIEIGEERDLLLTYNGSTSLTVTGGSDTNYEWYIDDVLIPNVTAGSLQLNQIPEWNNFVNGKYTIRVENKNQYGEKISANAIITVNK